MKFKGNLTTDGNVNAEKGTVKCDKLLVKYNGGYVDIIEVFSQMLGINREDTSTDSSTDTSTGTSGEGGETTGS